MNDSVQNPLIMGVVNVTPDSFSDGGKFINKNKAIEHGIKLLKDGADILDIGGESSRPGAQTIDPEQEMERVCPVIESLLEHTDQISIDTRNAVTMQESLKLGVSMVNDISALTHDPDSLGVVSHANCKICLMHMQGNPKNMQKNPNYKNVIEDVLSFFQSRISTCETYGIDKNRLILDPGIGFGKTLEHNLLILRNIREFLDLGCDLMLGTSRKSFIAKISKNEPENERLGGSLSSALWGISQGVKYIRVHDVKETVQAFSVLNGIFSL